MILLVNKALFRSRRANKHEASALTAIGIALTLLATTLVGLADNKGPPEQPPAPITRIA